MRPVAVVVVHELMDHGFEVFAAQDEHPVQTFTPDGADEALSEGVLHEVPGLECGWSGCPRSGRPRQSQS